MADGNGNPITIRDLKKSFGEQVVLNGISFEAAKGETLAVLGRSGTGKSVLLKILIGLQRPDAGSVCITGEEVSEAGEKRLNEIRKRMGFLFQGAALYDSLSIAENVAFPLSRHTQLSEADRNGKARELLAAVGLGKDVDKLPGEISGGMQKRVGLARALALDPEVLLCDEPTAGLDPITAAEIGQLIVDLKEKRQMTTIIVTHDLAGARRFSDRLVLLNEGRIAAEGSYADLEHSEDAFVRRFFEEAK